VAKHEEHEEHENHERWLVSYADFITLLFAFFVVMYAISSTDTKRAIQVEKSVRWALHIAGKGGGGDRILVPDGSLPGADSVEVVPMRGTPQAQSMVESTHARLRKKLSAMAGGGSRPSVLVLLDHRKMVLRVNATGLFDEGGAVLRPSALPTLDLLLQEAAALPGQVRIEGHTDAGGGGGLIDGNWQLSANRAAAVAAYAAATGAVPPQRLSLAGYGALRPIADNKTAGGREQNRRIEIVVELGDKPPAPPPPAKGGG
jgi:chemotaxis protein MotB